MANPYRPSDLDASPQPVRRRVLSLALMGSCAVAIALPSVVMALHLLNQEFQVIRTERQILLCSVNGVPVTNTSVAFTFLAVAGCFGTIACACLGRARRNHRSNSK